MTRNKSAVKNRIVRQKDRHTYEQTNRQTDRQTDRPLLLLEWGWLSLVPIHPHL